MFRYHLYKSKYVLIVNFFIALLVTITFSNIVASFQMTICMPDELSADYISFSLSSAQEVLTTSEFINEIKDYVENSNSNAIIMKYNDSKNCGVYAVGKSFLPEMVNGRTFSDDDFKYNTNTAIISENAISELQVINDKEYIIIDGNEYEVIGKFRPKRNNINRDATVYYNLKSEHIMKSTLAVSGRFAIDVGLNTKSIFNQISEKHIVEINHDSNELTLGRRLSTAIFSQPITIMPLFLVVLMVMLNSINITFSWIDKRKNELITRRICGASFSALICLLVRDYLLLSTSVYGLAFLATFVISKFNLFFFIGFDFSIITILISYATTAILGLVSITVMLLSSQMKTIIEQKG